MSDFAARARAAAAPMRALFPPTPLLRNDYLSQKFGADIWLKREDLSPVRSYKIRGAFNAMRKQLDRAPEGRDFVCASAGNHAQGVAFACRHFGVQGTIFMPVTTPQQKIMKTRAFGGAQVTIELTGDTFDQALAAAQSFCAERNAHFLSPFDDEDVIEGQASVAVEMLDQIGHAPDMVVLPVGGGGLSAGMTAYLAQEAPGCSLRYVEPAGGASLLAALLANGPVTLPRIDSFVDGASVARLGARTFARLANVEPDHVLIAPENRICITMLDLLNVEGLVLEPAGALSIDVLEVLRPQIAGKTVVCVASGGNFDFERLPEVKERAMRFAGTKKYLLLRLPQRPGALRDFLSILGPEDDIARFEYLKKTARNFGTVLLGIETTNPDNFTGLFARLDTAGFAFSDITEDEIMANFVI
ncbi:L-threonine dehydratase biosynthetic IlvA [Roseibaca ekhonensis]|jgi:threonine dehydratase|uniref:L-threonine dehydratase n=1 Tax=Roseinatronobacter ekhonensis TaxID=254356 RepID=A0A3B0MQ23_9RHOB|nr:threonine ammonia-lyase IlvA [Roseibaca ekhonensis]SUZ31729.1 L-threonine dehydratase biosynthetic IlvA [Roseibaca ekhonensis]